MPSTPRRAAIAVAAVLTAVTLVACSSGDGVRNAVAVGGGAPSSSTHQEAKPRLSTQRRNVPRCRASPARR